MVVVDLSGGGALVEGPWRFRPGSHCELALTLMGQEMAARARVTRCYVARVERGLIRYRAALAFEARLELPARIDALDGYEVLAVDRPRTARGVADTRMPVDRPPGGPVRAD